MKENYINVPAIIIIVIVLTLLLIVFRRHSRKHQEMIRQFVDKHGYSFTEKLTALPGIEDSYYLAPLRKDGSASQNFTHIISGSYNSKPFRMFGYSSYLLTHGRKRYEGGHDRQIAVLELTHTGSWPNMYFQRNTLGLGRLGTMIYAFTSFTLGTEFDTYFGTFSLPEKQAEVKQWFDLGKQTSVLNAAGRSRGLPVKGRNFINAIEFTPTKLYFYTYGFKDEAQIYDLLGAAEEIISAIK
jgi:hypothetical protein